MHVAASCDGSHSSASVGSAGTTASNVLGCEVHVEAEVCGIVLCVFACARWCLNVNACVHASMCIPRMNAPAYIPCVCSYGEHKIETFLRVNRRQRMGAHASSILWVFVQTLLLYLTAISFGSTAIQARGCARVCVCAWVHVRV